MMISTFHILFPWETRQLQNSAAVAQCCEILVTWDHLYLWFTTVTTVFAQCFYLLYIYTKHLEGKTRHETNITWQSLDQLKAFCTWILKFSILKVDLKVQQLKLLFLIFLDGSLSDSMFGNQSSQAGFLKKWEQVVMRITAYVIHTIQWQHLPIAIVLVIETQPLTYNWQWKHYSFISLLYSIEPSQQNLRHKRPREEISQSAEKQVCIC